MFSEKQIAEFAFDLHTGLSHYDVPDFYELRIVGITATLAVHIKGLGEIPYDVLRKVSSYYMSIQTGDLDKSLEILEEIEFIRVVKSGRKIEKIIPNIPKFEDVYQKIGAFAKNECDFNEHEQATMLILEKLQSSPYNQDSLINKTNIDKDVFKRCLDLSCKSGIVSSHKARGKTILISPFYFADNFDGLADIASSCSASNIQTLLTKIKQNQGWSLNLLKKQQEIGGSKLSETEISLINRLSEEGILKPPSFKFKESTEAFIFTPKPGNVRLNGANRIIYERAIALISAVRKGQLLADQYRIKNPLSILKAFRDRGYIGSNSEAKEQYKHLSFLGIAKLIEVSSSRYQLHLINTDDNKSSLDLAIEILNTGTLANVEVNKDAIIALNKDESYIQSLISSSQLKERKTAITKEGQYELEALLTSLPS